MQGILDLPSTKLPTQTRGARLPRNFYKTFLFLPMQMEGYPVCSALNCLPKPGAPGCPGTFSSPGADRTAYAKRGRPGAQELLFRTRLPKPGAPGCSGTFFSPGAEPPAYATRGRPGARELFSNLFSIFEILNQRYLA